MNPAKKIKTCLVISYGPVPTPQYQTIEGGGMRAWGLAQGLKRGGVQVTIAINNSFPQELTEHEDIRLTNWGQDQHFIDLLNTYDAVIVSYCMGSDSVFIAENIHDSVQLILDAYVPIYVEVSARESVNVDFEYTSYLEDIKRFNRVLKRGDYFLCANQAQKVFYTGVLASLGIINPRSYRQERILIAPFGIHDLPAKASENPYAKLGIKDDDFAVMWFGGLYPWFRVEELLGAILELSKDKKFKFVFVGGKNPFNPNPDFAKQYDKAFAFAEEHKLTNRSVFFVDWVDFEKRVNWFKHANIVISLNQPGEENGFSWRTRVMDFVWGELAILTNGGDPLSEDLLAANAALRLEKLSAQEIVHVLNHARTDKSVLKTVRANIIKLKPTYFWHNITKPIETVIANGDLPYVAEKQYKKKLNIRDITTADVLPPVQRSGALGKAIRLARLPKRAYSYARRKGLKRSLHLAAGIAKTQVQSRLATRDRRYVFVAHPMDNTGAPAVLMQMIREYVAAYGAKNVRLVVPYIAPNLLREVRELGVKVDKAAAALGPRLIKFQLDLRKNDFVLMNTIAVYDQYRDFIFHELRTGALKHAYWFIHEDQAQIPAINQDFLRKDNLTTIKELAEQKKLTLVTPSLRTRKEYVKLFGTPDVQNIPLLVDVPDELKKVRPASDFKTLRFFISGAAADGRKGQLIAISAFYDFMARYYNANPKAYRDFSLCLLSVGDNYISQQVRWIGDSLLGKRLETHPMMPREDALKLASTYNVVMCCSLNETFGLYIAESMHMGNVVVRNNSAGVDEQLKEGVNGYRINHKDIHNVADVIEKLLNKKTTSNEALQAMGMASQKIISGYSETNYLQKIESLTQD